MGWNMFRITVEIPALDRFVDYLESTDQKAIDAIQKTFDDATAKNKQKTEAMKTALQQSQK